MSAESKGSLIKKMRKWKGQLEKRGLNVNVGKTESPFPPARQKRLNLPARQKMCGVNDDPCRKTKLQNLYSPPLDKKIMATTTTLP